MMLCYNLGWPDFCTEAAREDDQLAGDQRQFPAPGYSLESFEVPVATKLTLPTVFIK